MNGGLNQEYYIIILGEFFRATDAYYNSEGNQDIRVPSAYPKPQITTAASISRSPAREILLAWLRAKAMTSKLPVRQAMARQIFDDMNCLSHPASCFLWLPLSGEVRADKILKHLIPEKISVSTAEPFSTGKYVPQAIRIALGSVPVEKLEHALNRIKEAVLYQRDL